MDGLTIKVGSEERRFLPNGSVVTVKNGAETVRGKWRSTNAGEKANRFHYTFDNAAPKPFAVKYEFNEFNQLVATALKGGDLAEDSAPFVFQGRIMIDDAHDVVYELFNQDGTEARHAVTIFGDLSISEDIGSIVIALADGGGRAAIKGDQGVVPIMALENLSSFAADDLLRFSATTHCNFDGATKRTRKRAIISFVGKWDFKERAGENQLVFVSKVTTGAEKEIVVGAAGRIGAVEAGFAYFADKEGSQLAFTVRGEHKWDSAEAKWHLKLGHTKKLFKASIDGEFAKNMPDGQFRLTGSFAIEHAADKKAAMKLSIEGTWEFKNNMIVFKVMADTAANRYELSLDGKFVFDKTTLLFQVRYNKTGRGSKLEFKLETTANKERLKFFLSAVLEKTGPSLTVGFEMTVRWRDGVVIDGEPTKELVKKAPVPLPA